MYLTIYQNNEISITNFLYDSHLNGRHLVNERSSAQVKVQMQIIGQLETQVNIVRSVTLKNTLNILQSSLQHRI